MPKSKKTFGLNAQQPAVFSTPARKALAARIDPFSNEADGARCLDEYSFPTAVRRVEKRFNITTDASGNVGLVLLPNLSDVSAFTGGVNRAGGGTLTNAASAFAERSITFSALDGIMRSHRIVGWGAKIVWTQNVTAIQGSYTVAGMPCLASGNFYDALSEAATTSDRSENVYDALGIPYLGIGAGSGYVDVTALTALPYATASTPIAKGEDVYLVSKATSAHSTFFRQSNARRVGGDAVDDSTSLLKAQAWDMSYQSKHGWEAFVLGVRGASANTSIAEVTLVYHIEGVPTVSSGAIRDASVDMSPCAPAEAMAISATVATMPNTCVADPYRRAKFVSEVAARVVPRIAAPVVGMATYAVTKNPATAAKAYNLTRAVVGGNAITSRNLNNGLLLTNG